MFSHKLHPGYGVRPKVWLSALLTAVLVGVYLWLASMLVQVSSPDTLAVAATPAKATVQAAAINPAPSTSVPNCTPMPATDLSSVSLDTKPAGLTDRTEPANQYRIYGDTADQIRDQIRHCAPGNDGNGGAEYTANTAYSMSWQYDTLVTGNGACRVTNAKVGVRIRMTLPQWEPTATTTAGLTSKWQNFMNALTAHESGHAALDAQYAAKLTTDLGNLPTMDCDSLRAAVQQVVDTDIAALNRANNNYDASTNHGATQGAVLPQ